MSAKICDAINKTDIFKHEFTPDYVCNVHRNKAQVAGSRPPSITLVFLRGMDKDQLFYKKKHFKTANLGFNLFHALSPRLINEQKKIQSCSEVEWCAWFGHTQYFSVKMKNGDFERKVMSLCALEDRLDCQLTRG